MDILGVSGAVAVWLASSVLGLCVSSYGLIEALRDAGATAGLTNGRRLVARQRVLAQGIRTGAFFLWTALGIFLVTIDVQLTFTVLVLVATNVAYTVLAISDAYVGWRLRNGA